MSASKTLATSYFMQSHTSAESARRELYQQNIKTSYNDNIMIFTALHTAKNSLNNHYIQECNGLILEQKTWRPLVVPPRTLRFNIDTDASNRFLHQGLYHIYKVQDGTCFNLYHFNGKWVISTARGHTMNDVKWNGDKTYQEIITECLERIGLTWDNFTLQLNLSSCYSFGFRHPLMQKFREGNSVDIYRLWFIQSVCLDESDPKYLWSSDVSPIVIIPAQETYPSTVGNLRELYKLASSALQDYLDKKEICYGYILRSVNREQTSEHSDLFIESSLMRIIRKTWYENNLIDQCHKAGWDKQLAITLHAYLDTQNYETFQRLFPEYSMEMEVYHKYIMSVITAMAQKTLTPTAEDPIHKNVVTILLQSFKDNIRMDTRGQNLASLSNLYFEYVCHPEALENILANSADYLRNEILAMQASQVSQASQEVTPQNPQP